jgi:hypothetical protein
MKILQIIGTIWLVAVGLLSFRLYLGWDHITHDDIPPMVIGGLCGGLGSWYFGKWRAKKPAAGRNEN